MPQKPPREPGQVCPLMKKDVSECCHVCDWYASIPVGQTDQHGRVANVHDQWDCTAKHLLKVFRDWGAILEGVQTATESGRNEIAGRLDVVAEDLMTMAETTKEMGRAAGIQTAPMLPYVQRRIGGAIKQIAKKS